MTKVGEIMRRYIFWLLMLAMVPGVAAAQQARAGRPGQVGNPARMLLERRADLDLTDEQVTRLEGLATRFDEQRTTMREHFRQDRAERREWTEAQRAEMREAMQESRHARHALRDEVRSVLTPEQANQVEPLRMERGRARGRGMEARPRRGPALWSVNHRSQRRVLSREPRRIR